MSPCRQPHFRHAVAQQGLACEFQLAEFAYLSRVHLRVADDVALGKTFGLGPSGDHNLLAHPPAGRAWLLGSQLFEFHRLWISIRSSSGPEILAM